MEFLFIIFKYVLVYLRNIAITYEFQFIHNYITNIILFASPVKEKVFYDACWKLNVTITLQ